jgi:hypothetical protein
VELSIHGQAQRLTLETFEKGAGRSPRDRAGDTHPQVFAHRDRAVVEQPMVEGAERQAVRHLVRTAVGVPSDVSGVHPDQALDQAEGEAADAALGEVGPEHVRSERGAPTSG